MRLIDGDAIIEEYCGDCPYKGTELCGEQVPACGTAMWIAEAPTVDAVEVVRCKDCVYYRPQNQSTQWNHSKRYCMRKVATKVTPNDYCSYGKRKENT